ncbi:MAG: BBE domain-containing protein, partial [Candidatus Limnocylindria bacterium]
AMHGTEDAATRLLDTFVASVGTVPVSEYWGRMPYREALRRLSGLGSIESDPDHPVQGDVHSRSEFFRRRLPRQVIGALLDNLMAGPRPGQSRELSFTPWGGAYNRVSTGATAFAHRDELFMIEHVAVVDERAPRAERAAARDWLTRSWSSVHPWGSGRVYPNFPDPDLQDWHEAYHATNYDRLVRVKRKYDPDSWFRFPQSIGSRTADRPESVDLELVSKVAPHHGRRAAHNRKSQVAQHSEGERHDRQDIGS